MALENLFDNYIEFEEIVKNRKDDEIDLGNLELNPATVLPLLCDCKNNDLEYGSENAYEYLNKQLIDDKLFSRLPESRKESDDSDFITGYMDNIDSSYGSYFALRHIVSELANNIYDHAGCGNKSLQSYIFSKLHFGDKKLDICVIDDGISIPGLFESFDVDFNDDCHAIEKAIGSFSTVSDTFFERGNGLRTIVRLVSEGNNGEILIISRSGCLHICGENYKYYLLDEKYSFNGTVVGVRLNKYEIQNIYDLLEPNKLNSYKYLR